MTGKDIAQGEPPRLVIEIRIFEGDPQQARRHEVVKHVCCTCAWFKPDEHSSGGQCTNTPPGCKGYSDVKDSDHCSQWEDMAYPESDPYSQ